MEVAALHVGQVWVCSALEDTPPLMCIIGKIDEIPAAGEGQRIVSICVRPHPEAEKAGWPIVWHMPVSEEAFQMSGLRLVKDGVLLKEDFESGYSDWFSAFENGKAGVFTIDIRKAYQEIVSLISKQ